MWGAHHRILANSVLPGRACAWTVLDYGHVGKTSMETVLAEAGACADAGPLRVGAGFGYDRSTADLALGSRQKIEGWHAVAEADLRLGDSGAVFSGTAIYGRWTVDIDRKYLNGAVINSSFGSSDADGVALRGRLDWFDMIGDEHFALSPFISYTWSRVKVDSYTETGGAFPVAIGRSIDKASEGRAGLVGRFSLAEATSLRFSGEYIHRFDQVDNGLAFQIIGTGFGANTGPYAVDRDQARLGVEVDQRISGTGLISFAAHRVVGNRQGNPFSLSAALNFGF